VANKEARQLLGRMDELPQFYILILGLASVSLIWLCNRWLETELACSILCILPISLVAWYVGGPWAVILPVVAGVAAFQADLLSRDVSKQLHSPYWTAVARFICYMGISHLLVLCKNRAVVAANRDPQCGVD